MNKICLSVFLALALFSCKTKDEPAKQTEQPVYTDIPYVQDYAIKYTFEDENRIPQKVFADRNGIVKVLTNKGLYFPVNGHFQYPGSLNKDNSYLAMLDKEVVDFTVYRNQFVYLDKQAVYSNAWAGKLYSKHEVTNAQMICAGEEFQFLVSNGKEIAIVDMDGVVWATTLQNQNIIDIKYDDAADQYLLLCKDALFSLPSGSKNIEEVLSGKGYTCFAVRAGKEVILGTNEGYTVFDTKTWQSKGGINDKLPCTDLSTIAEVNGKLWFGSSKGAFMLRDDGKFNYYYGKRWINDNQVIQISKGPDNSVLLLTEKGLGKLCFELMTLEEKALVYEDQVRKRHIRYGFNSNVNSLQNHDLASNRLNVADSDNLWTGMYLASQLFRFLVTGDEEAKQNCLESFEAMERVHEINGINGLFGRTFERRGIQSFHKEYRSYVDNYWYDGYQGTISWRHAGEQEWDWRASASSDQTVGQMFALTIVAEYSDDEELKQRAVLLIDQLMTYIVENDYCLVDYNGLPSLWGRWHPEYVNRFDTMIGDRKVYSSNLIAFLQTAYRFTGKEIFKEKAFDLIREHGYYENLMRPFSEIGNAPEDADAWSKMLSQEWNHSDDEMYFLAYWGLYPYAFNDTLKEGYKAAIKDHWEWERPEKNSLWIFCYAMTGAIDFDLEESIWHLKEFPLDLIQYEVQNSHRKDIQFQDINFWGQTLSEVLPPDERPELKHNRNLFKLDGGNRNSELSAGDTFLLPYWMGRYLGVISAPKTAK